MNSFEKMVTRHSGKDLTAQSLDTLQVNVGAQCNKRCAHCHLDASPSRAAGMDWKIMKEIIAVARDNPINLVDITGGAPEMNPNLKVFIAALSGISRSVQVRTNLTALVERNLPDITDFFAEHRVRLVASMPCYLEENVDAQRGVGTHGQSIIALRRLNELGYGETPDLPLDLVYNPAGAFLTPPQQSLEQDYQRELSEQYGIRFRSLLTIANMPIGRFLKSLQSRNEYEEYMTLLKQGFNPETLGGLMCRKQVSVRWDGALFDCDFNLALDMHVIEGTPDHIRRFDAEKLAQRKIVTGEHCFGCTAGGGSSCAGVIVAN